MVVGNYCKPFLTYGCTADKNHPPDRSNSLVDVDNRRPNQLDSPRLKPSLSSLETWGFGVSGLLLWLGTAPSMNAALGPKALFVWLPGAIVGIMLNLQVKQLGTHWPQMSGGTPNYTTRLLNHYPGLARYGAIGYLLGWVSVPPMNAIILTDLIKANLDPLGISCPVSLLRIGFTALPFLVAFSGTRALGILHSCFVFPAIGFLLAFCIQGIAWLGLAPASPGLFPISWSVSTLPVTSLHFGEWAKWFFIAVYAVYGCETASSFVADSRRPRATLRCLEVAAWLIPPVYIGGSWVLMCLATSQSVGDNAFFNLSAAATPFWGNSASFLVTFLIACGCLLSSTTAVSNSPRILYQLALDGHLSPVFAVVSRQGVLGPSLKFTLILSLLCLMWGDIDRVVMVTGTGYLCGMLAIHLGLWLRRGMPEVRWPWLSGGFFLVEAVVLVVGGLAWSWQDFLIGLLLPVAILAGNAAMRRVAFPPFHASWWLNHYRDRDRRKMQDFVLVQVGVLILLVCGATAVGWFARARLETSAGAVDVRANLFAILLLTSGFVGVAIACWTSLPQVGAIVEAREQAEKLFTIALDAIVVVDENGAILQANPATEQLFGVNNSDLMGRRLNQLLPGLADVPASWPSRSEQTLAQSDRTNRILEVAISDGANRDVQEYVAIVRDITSLKQTEADLRQALQNQEDLAATATAQAQQLEATLKDLRQTQSQLIQTEKMSSLGQLVAGVAHEINNPVNFIHGNLTHVNQYTQELVELVQLYQYFYSNPTPEIQELTSDIELDFLIEDLPKTIDSMKVGTQRIREIVLSLRNFSRLDEAEMKAIDIHSGIDSTLLILQNRLKAKSNHPDIKVVKEYGNLPLVECYGGQLNQVFMNILSNAIDALDTYNKNRSAEENRDNPSTITIRTEMRDSNVVTVRIGDNGPGMSKEVRSRLFDPFFTTKPVGKGTGLGLSISYQIIVEKHKGAIWCKSEPGQGAEFWIEIPVCQG
jgi:PAS domain S-box-containing protein